MTRWLVMVSLVLLPGRSSGQQEEAPFSVLSAKPLPALTRCFQQTEGWTGGDGASSIRLGPKRTLWLFADSWIGKIEGGRRVDSQMINNSCAWQTLPDKKTPLHFFWDKTGKGPAALFQPFRADAWFWPGDGVLIDGRLYLFCKVVRKAKGAPGLEFEWFDNELLQIANPQDEPTTWKIERTRLPQSADALRLGSACLLEGEYLYVYGLFPTRLCKPLETPLALARIPRDKLTARDMTGWSYWCRASGAKRWVDQPKDPVPLFQDAAPEMTIGHVEGINGFVATYTSLGLGSDILVRHATRPEGPWSKPVRVYRCPEAEEKLLLYGAKAHPELADRDGQLVITYCRNIGSLAEHMRRPEVYFPQAVEVLLRSR